jgi:hypothetical protein
VEGMLRKKEQDYDVVMDLLEKENYSNHQKNIEIAKLKDLVKGKNVILDWILGSKNRRVDLFAEPHPDSEE